VRIRLESYETWVEMGKCEMDEIWWSGKADKTWVKVRAIVQKNAEKARADTHALVRVVM